MNTPAHEVLQLPCPACGTLNRVPVARVQQHPGCGRCHAALLPGHPVAVTDASFERQVERCALPVLLDLWAPWCAPCRSMEPVLAHIAQRHATRLKVVKVNVDENPDLARRFAVRSIPSLRLLRGAQEVDRLDGAASEQSVEQHIARLLDR